MIIIDSLVNNLTFDNSLKFWKREVALMMHGFGDSSEPLTDSVRLVEALTRQQIRRVVREALLLANRRDREVIEVKDIIFLMRHCPHSLRRLQKFVKSKAFKLNSNGEYFLTKNGQMQLGLISNAIDEIDETGRLKDLNIFDPVRHQRLLRADRISSSLDETKYMEYYKARCSSFMSREFNLLQNIEDFKTWLLSANEEKVELSNFIVEILAYLAFETVAFIIDIALMVRVDVNRVVNDPLSGLKAGNFCNPTSFNTSRVYERFKETGIGQEGMMAITPSEIREAVRRYEMSQIGQFMSSNYNNKIKRPFLCFQS